MKVYLLYHGSRYVRSEMPEVYTYKANVVAQAEKILTDKIVRKRNEGKDDLIRNIWKEIEPEGNVIKAWQSQTEEIIIYEVETK